MTMPQEQFREIMHRTMHNLAIIERLKDDTPTGESQPFEVTQLVNSFLGALAIPRERDLLALLQGRSITEAEQRWGLPQIHDEYPSHPLASGCRRNKPDGDLGRLVALLRHGFAHGNIQFLNDDSGNIDRVRIWNEIPNGNCKGEKTWGATLDIPTLKRLLEAFVALADHLYDETTSN